MDVVVFIVERTVDEVFRSTPWFSVRRAGSMKMRVERPQLPMLETGFIRYILVGWVSDTDQTCHL